MCHNVHEDKLKTDKFEKFLVSHQQELNRLSTLLEAEKEKNLTNNQQKDKASLETENQSSACQEEVKTLNELLREKDSKVLELNKEMESLSAGLTENLQK